MTDPSIQSAELPAQASSAETIEAQRLKLDRFKAVQDARLQRRRLDLEREKSDRDSRFHSNPALISAAISFAAVLVSGAQVWSALISKDKELALAHAQRERDRELQSAEQQRQWELSRAKWLLENRQALLGGDPAMRQRTVMLIQTFLPKEVADQLLSEPIKTTTSSQVKPPLIATSTPSSTSTAALVIKQEFGDKQVIGLRQWQKFGVKVLDPKGQPVVGAYVAWQMPQSGPLTYVGQTDDEGISTATNMFTSATPGTFTQVAYLAERNGLVGFVDAALVRAKSKPVVFEFTQK